MIDDEAVNTASRVSNVYFSLNRSLNVTWLTSISFNFVRTNHNHLFSLQNNLWGFLFMLNLVWKLSSSYESWRKCQTLRSISSGNKRELINVTGQWTILRTMCSRAFPLWLLQWVTAAEIKVSFSDGLSFNTWKIHLSTQAPWHKF